jgi:hypothetical protein
MRHILASLALFAAVCLMGFHSAGAVTAPQVSLAYPLDGYLSPSENITISCNASDDENLYSMSLYLGVDGNFNLYETNFTMSLQNDSSTLLFCGFDNSSYTCLDGEEATTGGTGFENSTMGTGVLISGSDTVSYPSSGNIDGDRGTLEAWLRVDFDPLGSSEYDIFSTDSGTNDIRLWKDSTNGVYDTGTLKLEYYSYGSLAQSAEADITNWTIGEWHHIAAIWDADVLMGGDSGVDLFLDGSNVTTLSAASLYCHDGFGDIHLGSSSQYGWETSSFFDEIAVYSRVLTADEIEADYERFFENHSVETYNWTLPGLDDGTYTWNCMAVDNESQGAWGAADYTFIVDTSPPSVVSVNLTPDDEASLDPGIPIAVVAKMTDVSNVSSVILMYKSPYAGLYTNDTMDYNSVTGLWENGTIVTNLDEGDWSYKFWSNDSWGHAGMSDASVIPVEKDRTWTLQVRNASGSAIESLGEVRGFAGSTQEAGILCMNNTGDYVSNFDLSADFADEVSYNDTEPFDLSPGASKCLDVDVAIPETPNEYELVIDAETTSLPAERSVNASVISYIGGPYINDSIAITSYPLSLGQSASGNFTARVKNIGNETAHNVTLNWTFPSGWSLSYGNASELLGNIEAYHYIQKTVTAYAGSGADAGAAIVQINASSINGTAGSDFRILSVTCTSGDGACGSGCTYLSDTDCETPAPAGGNTRFIGGGMIGISEPSIFVSFPERLDIRKGEKKVILINVSNHVRGSNVTDVSLEISGYESRLVSVSPSSISYVNPLQNATFSLEISAPAYMEEKVYVLSVTVKAVGSAPGMTKSLESSSNVLVSVHGVMGNESFAAMNDAQKAIDELSGMGLSVGRLEGLLSDARKSYDELDFDAAAQKARDIIGMKEVALGLMTSFSGLEANITKAERYFVLVPESKKLMELAQAAFQRGDYARAQARITAAIAAYDHETGAMGILMVLGDYWLHIIALASCLAVSSFFARRKVKKIILQKKSADIKTKKEALRALLSQLQEKYYKKSEISKAEYLATKATYKKRIAFLSSEELRLKRQAAGRRKRDLETCLLEAQEELKKLQRGFFETGGLDREEYELETVRLQGEIAGIEKDISKAGRKKTKGFMGIAIIAIIAASALQAAQVSAIGNVTADDALFTIAGAEKAIGEMQARGLSFERANGTLESARMLFSEGDFGLCVTSASYVSVIRDKAFSVDATMDETEMRLQEFSAGGHDVSSLEEKFSYALSDFGDENYEDAESALTYIDDALDEMKNAEIQNENILTTAVAGIVKAACDAWVAVVIALVACIIVSVPVSKRIGKARRKKRIGSLKEGVESVKEAVRSLQGEYFQKGSVSKKAYASRLEKHRKELAALMEKLAAEERNDGKEKGGV